MTGSMLFGPRIAHCDQSLVREPSAYRSDNRDAISLFQHQWQVFAQPDRSSIVRQNLRRVGLVCDW